LVICYLNQCYHILVRVVLQMPYTDKKRPVTITTDMRATHTKNLPPSYIIDAATEQQLDDVEANVPSETPGEEQ
jgi:hypothetical protein